MASDLGQGVQDIGGAVSALFGAEGSAASAKSYDEASAIATQNAQIVASATAIKEAQTSRAIFQTIGKQQAQIGGAGFAASGTAIDLLRSSASQGALEKAVLAENGAIQENSYAEQAGLYAGLAGSARSAGTGQKIGGLIQAAGGAIDLASSAYKYLADAASSASAASTAAADGAAANVVPGIGTPADAVAAGVSDIGIGQASGAAADTVATVDAATTAESAGAVTAADTIGTAAAVTEGSSIADTAVVAAAAWIICTELHRQGRLSSRYYYSAASTFLAYPERGKRGYYVWAIPSVRHLRAHPESRYSKFMEWLFTERARYITHRLRGRPTTWTGATVTHGLYAMCWALSWFVPERLADWKGLTANG